MRTEPSFSAEPENRLSGNLNHQSDYDEESQLLSDYRQRYGLSTDPFADDPHFPLYTGAQRRQILDQLLHLCQFSNNLLVVLGEYSVGKTRMAQALIDSLDDADDICFLEGQVTSDFHALSADIIDQFELPDIEAFADFSARQSDQDGIAVLIVDNAHHLADTVLLELITLIQDNAASRVHLVLFAEPYLMDRLDQMDAPGVVLSDFYLERFSLNETVDYLNFRMEMADYLGPEIFTEATVEHWWRQAQGQLLALHEFAQDKLLASVSAANSSAFNRRGLPIPHIVGASVLGGALLMGYLYWGGESSAKKEPVRVTESIPVVKSAAQLDVNPQAVAASSFAQSNASTQVEMATTSVIAANVSPASVSGQESSIPVVAEKNPDAVVKQSVVPLAQTNSLQQDAGVKSNKTSASTAPKEIKKTELEREIAKQNTPPKPVAKADSKSAEKVKSTAESNGYSEQEKTILSWGESEYTLQLVGLSSEKSVRDFVAEQPNKKELLVFKSLRQGKDWFVVVIGHYPSSAKARQAIELLPESQKKASPWPRDLKTIQKEIKQFN